MNLRPSGYEPDELPDCSTPRLRSSLHHHSLCFTALPLRRFVCRAVCSAKKEIMSELFYPCNPTHPKTPQSPLFFAHLLSIQRPLFKQLHPLTRSNTQPVEIIENYFYGEGFYLLLRFAAAFGVAFGAVFGAVLAAAGLESARSPAMNSRIDGQTTLRQRLPEKMP